MSLSGDIAYFCENLPKLIKTPIQSNEDCLPGEKDLAGISSKRTFCAGLRNGSGDSAKETAAEDFSSTLMTSSSDEYLPSQSKHRPRRLCARIADKHFNCKVRQQRHQTNEVSARKHRR